MLLLDEERVEFGQCDRFPVGGILAEVSLENLIESTMSITVVLYRFYIRVRYVVIEDENVIEIGEFIEGKLP